MSGTIFEEIAELRRKEEAERAVREMIGSTSALVWGALADAGVMETPDYGHSRSTPDYHEDHMSHDGDYYSSQMGPEYWDEKKQYEREERARGAQRVTASCIADHRADAEAACMNRTLPTGVIDETVEPLECVRMWAEGIDPAREGVTLPGADRESGWDVHVGRDSSAAGGGYHRTTTTHDPTHSREVDRPHAKGYNRDCFEEGQEWFNKQRAKTMEHYGE